LINKKHAPLLLIAYPLISCLIFLFFSAVAYSNYLTCGFDCDVHIQNIIVALSFVAVFAWYSKHNYQKYKLKKSKEFGI